MFCRLCLSKKNDMIGIFGEEGQNLDVAKIISLHFWFQVIREDDNTKSVCKACWKKTNEFHIFYCSVKKQQQSIKFQLNTTDENSLEDEAKSIKQEFTQPPDAVAINFQHVTIKEEDATDDSDVDFKLLIPEINELVVEETKLEVCNLKNELTMPKPTTKQQINKVNASNIPNKESNQKAAENCKMQCDICSTAFQDWSDIASHFKSKHQVKGYVMCICCNKRFYRKFRLLDHVEMRSNPDAFKCQICKKKFGDRHGLRAHMFYHKPSEEKQFCCDKCEKRFSHKNLLRQHLIFGHTTKEDRKIECPECGKFFLTPAILNNHTKVHHKGVYTILCEICAISFKTKHLYESHVMRTHSEVGAKPVQCVFCGIWLKEKSMYEHRKGCKSKFEKQEHVCDICEKIYPNAKALSSHKSHMHLKQKIHQCSVCEKSFKRPLSLKEHMAMHTGEVLYSCPYCPKTCNNSSNMYSHKKTHKEHKIN